MRVGRPGSVGWLLGQQLRWQWRALRRQKGTLILLTLLALGGVAFVLVLSRDVPALRTLDLGQALAPGGYVPVTLALLFLVTMLLSSAINASLEALFTRGDLDLLLHSPVPPRTVLASRALGVVAGMLFSSALLVVPLLLVALGLGAWRGLGLAVWWPATAAVVACAGVWLTLGLVRVIGVRRTRTVAAVLSALSGAAVFLGLQWSNMTSGRTEAAESVLRVVGAQPGQAGWPGPDSSLWYPARTAWFEPLPAAALTAFAAGVFALTVLSLTRQFTAGAQEAADNGPRRRRASLPERRLRFASGRRATLLKEWRLIGRDPEVLSRTLLQFVYLLPLLAMTRREGQAGAAAGLGVVLVASTLSAALANLTLNAEDAPDLLRSAPRPAAALRGEKWLAATLPTAVIGISALALLAAWGAFTPLLGSATLLLTLLGVAGSAALTLWDPLPVRRTDLFRKPQKPGVVSVLLSLTFQLGLAGTAYGVTVAASWAGYTLLAALAALGTGYLRRLARTEEV